MFSLSAISVRWLSLFLAQGEADLFQACLKRGSLFYLSEDNGIMQLFFIKTKKESGRKSWQAHEVGSHLDED